VKASHLDRPCLVEKWAYLGGVLTREEGDAFVAVGGLCGATPPQRRRTSLGKELREISRASLSNWLGHFYSLHLVFFTCYIVLRHIGYSLVKALTLHSLKSKKAKTLGSSYSPPSSRSLTHSIGIRASVLIRA
jgi:hypothetical protein